MHAIICRARAVDDGTALLPCTWWHDSFEQRYGAGACWFGGSGRAAPFKLGDYVKLCGQMKWFRGALQLRVAAASVECDPNSEALWHAEVMHLSFMYYRRHGNATAKIDARSQIAALSVPSSSLSSLAGGSEAANVLPGTCLVDALRYFISDLEEFSFVQLLQEPTLHIAFQQMLYQRGLAASEASFAQPEMQSATATRKAHEFTRSIGVLIG